MAQVIGNVKSFETGTFFVKGSDGQIRQLKVGDSIYEGENVYGAATNGANAKIVIDVLLAGAGDLVLGGTGALTFDTSVLAGMFSHNDAVVYVNSVKEALATISSDDAAVDEDISDAGETAAGDAVTDTERAGDVFAARTGAVGDVTTSLNQTGPTALEVTLNEPPLVLLEENSIPTVNWILTEGNVAVVDEGALQGGNVGGSLITSGTLDITTGGDTINTVGGVVINGVDVTNGGTVTGTYGNLIVTVSEGVYSWTYVLGDNAPHTDPTQIGVNDQFPEDIFSVVVTDDDGDSTAPVDLTVMINDDGPVAIADTGTQGAEDSDIVYNVMANDSHGADGATLTAASVAQGQGQVSFLSNGQVTYNPVDGEEGVVMINYTITDSDGDASNSTLTITLLKDSTPIIGPESGTVYEAQIVNTVSGTFDINSYDAVAAVQVNGINAIVGNTVTGTYGDLTFTANNGWTYTLSDNTLAHTQAGMDTVYDTFNLQMQDSDGDVAVNTMTIGVVDGVPTAVNDSASPAEDTPITINVLANDTVGPDEVNLATGVALGTAATKGTVAYNGNGTFTYTPIAGEVGSDSFTYTITDKDGDTSMATVSITLAADSEPTAGTTYASVDDDALSGNPASTTGDLTVPNTDGDNNEATFSGTLAHTPGGDIPVVISFAGMNGLSGTVGTENVSYAWVGNTLTATTTSGTRIGTALFNVEVTNAATGAYKVTLLDNVMHANGNDENDATVALNYTATDSDSSPAVPAGTLNITFDDDMPSVIDPMTAYVVNKTGSLGTITGVGLDIDNNVDNNYGADGGTVAFAVTNGSDSGYTTSTQHIYLYTSVDGLTMIGSTLAGSNFDAAWAAKTASGAFVVTLDPNGATPDTYDFTLLKQIDGGIGSFNTSTGSWDFHGGNTNYVYYDDTSGNGLPSVLLTPTGAEGDKMNATAHRVGVTGDGGGQATGDNEAIRVDFVDQNITGNPLQVVYNPSTVDHAFLNHVMVNGAVVTFAVNSKTTTVNFRAFDDLDYGTTDEQNDVGDYKALLPTGQISEKITRVIVNGVAYIADNAAAGIDFMADGSVTISGITNSNKVAVFTDSGFTTVEYHYVSGTPFSLAGFGASTFNPGELVNMGFDLAVIDGDGDRVLIEDGIQIQLSPDDHIVIQDFGGVDYLEAPTDSQAVTLVGLDGDDTLIGKGGNDILIGGESNDTLIGGAGDDILISDVATIGGILTGDTGLDSIDGGAGIDTLVLTTGSNINFSMLDSTNNPIMNIEAIDLSVNGDHQLQNISHFDILDITGGGKTLTILGDAAADAVSVDDVTMDYSGLHTGVLFNGESYDFNIYTSSIDPTVILRVENSITDTLV